MNIYVGNLSFQVAEDELKKAFESYGQTSSVSVIKDKFSGQSRGFGFVEMPQKSEAEAAINGLNGTILGDRPLMISEARPRESRSSGDSRGDSRERRGGRF